MMKRANMRTETRHFKSPMVEDEKWFVSCLNGQDSNKEIIWNRSIKPWQRRRVDDDDADDADDATMTMTTRTTMATTSDGDDDK